MAKEYITLAKDIIKKHGLDIYTKFLLEFWLDSPTTLGHGFSHVLRVAVESYEIAVLNNYQNPEFLFIGGLFHDVIRPAEDKGGEEDQTAGAKVVKEMFDKNGIDENITKLISDAIISHDSWIGEANPPIFDLILSTGDKASHDITMAYGYAWASNKYCRENNKDPMFKNHFQTLYMYNKYQQRAWNLFAKNPIKGTERAIRSYIDIYITTSNNYINDPKGENFASYIESIAEKVKNDEKEYLKAFGTDTSDIQKLLKNFY